MKETLFLLPGLLCDRSLWRHQIEILSQEYDVRVADFSKGRSIEEYVENVLEDAPETFSIAALSMGAYVALEIAKKNPGRVKRLALLNASPFADLPEHAAFRENTMTLAREQGLGRVTEMILGKLIHSSRYEDDELIKVIDAMAHKTGVETFIDQQTALLNRLDYSDFLPEIDCPTVVIVGRQDGMTPVKISKGMVEKINSASLVEIENCGHLSALEQPEAVTAVLRYWMQS